MQARTVAIAVAATAYVLGTHWLMTRSPASPWDAVGVLAPMLVAVAVGAWRAGQRWLGAGAVLAIAALCGPALLGRPLSAQALYVAQHAGIHLFLAVVFGSTLRHGHTPLITTLASRVHTVFTAEMAAYTRKVTLAWTLYFVAMALLSVGLFAFAPFDTWALFANLLTPLAVATMFVAEFRLRYWWHPDFERTSLAEAIRSYRLGTKPQPARPGPLA